jgi:hypothetical protein
MKTKEGYSITDIRGQVHEFSNIEEYQRFIKRHPLLFIEPIPKDEPVDNGNHPSHYADRKYEVIDVMQDTMQHEHLKGYLFGASFKYMMRWDKKENPLQDLKKARWYLDRLIQTIEEEQPHAMARE